MFATKMTFSPKPYIVISVTDGTSPPVMRNDLSELEY
jgi:hypothetical protein